MADSIYEQELDDQKETSTRRKRATSSGGFTYEENSGVSC